MKIPKNVNVVNDSYRTLSERAIMLRNTLEKLGYNVEWGYYDRHTVTVNGDNFLEYYPIPVLTVNGICDIAVDFLQVSIDGKLFAAEFEEKLDFAKLKSHGFECYGVENYLESLYVPGMSFEELVQIAAPAANPKSVLRQRSMVSRLQKKSLSLCRFSSAWAHTPKRTARLTRAMKPKKTR